MGTGKGPAIHSGIIDQLLMDDSSDETIISELYLRTLTRVPEPAERIEWATVLSRAPDKREAVEDLLWTLLNSRDFAFNH